MEEPSNFTQLERHDEDDQPLSDEETDLKVAKMTMIGLYVIIFFFSLVGNSLIFRLVHTRKSIRKNQFYWLIVNTAVADLMDVVTASAFSVAYFLYEERWGLGVFGAFLCKIIPFLLVTSICAAIWTLTVIAVDRYLVIVCLRRRALSSRSVLCSICAVWLCAALVSIGQLYKFKMEIEDDGTAYCIDEWSDQSEETSLLIYKAEMVTRVVITYAIPLFVIAILYFLIARFLWKRKPPVSVNQHAYNNQIRKRKTVIKMLITVVTVFAVCWFPVHVSHIMSKFHQDAYSDIPEVLRWLFFWLAHANAAIHPWLFIAFSEHLREGTKEIYRDMCKPNQLRLRHGSTPSLATINDPLSRSVTPPKGSVRGRAERLLS